MAESHTIVALRDKRDNIERMIAAYTKKIEDGRRDLAHVNATLRLFEIGSSSEGSTYVDTMRLFKRGEIITICKAALAKHGPLDTRELARHVVKTKGFDEKDTVLRKSLSYRIVMAMRMQWKRGKVSRQEKRKGVIVWKL